MDEIYKLCDNIIEKKVLSKEALEIVLKGIAKGSGRKKLNKYDSMKARAWAMNYRAKRMGAAGKVNAKDLSALIRKQKKCQCCGSKNNLVFDHITSLYKGGDNKIENLQILCNKCNTEKGVN